VNKGRLNHVRTRDDDCGSPSDTDAGIDDFRTNVVPFTREQGRGAILRVDRQSGEAIVTTIWENEQALQESEESANTLRAAAANQMGATQAPTVGRY
jgi:hypothetical protein